MTLRLRQLSLLARDRRGWKYGTAQILTDLGLRKPKIPPNLR
jgi:hypothetical protein